MFSGLTVQVFNSIMLQRPKPNHKPCRIRAGNLFVTSQLRGIMEYHNEANAEGGGTKSFHSLKGGGGYEKVYPVLSGGAQKVSDPQFSHFVAPRPRN